ncbi:class I SAM-dependent methyltransferase [Parabacteroides chinchillae]|uniref:2-polyprenyl-6-hydroxyphenyl methylase / 3-demethylubiquinone-9 3-methyltransferase n=1 Tax=Parabacteroides chinchillae TaxID=871327 RepID=A0A8G2BYJ4_9BACT|nr:class I SAM-dependent methyltransferase [Parabacteroides chinchillae]SEG20502.1 2-polyprenyl-6-hydroxyphenyl methylase / 3-demethylubiquinone-9 3-methyltransferase [Parabacteroides chinchillae]
MPAILDFGWKDDAPAFYHRYLCDPIEKMLPKDGSPILDIGCGNGYFANKLIDKGYCVYGIDFSEKGIAIANRKHPGHFFANNIETDNLPAKLQNIRFKTIISTEVIEHLYNPESFVVLVRNILKNNLEKDDDEGIFILSTPYHGYLKNIMLALAGKMDYHYSALWVGGHIKFWSRNTISRQLSQVGFKDIKFKGAGRFPYLWCHMIIQCKITT